jgi:hypothetical protein
MKILPMLIFLNIIHSAEYSPNINNSNELDKFILRISNRYSIQPPHTFYSKPMHTIEISQFLDKADSLDKKGILTTQESYRLKNLKEKFHDKRSIFNWRKKEWNTENYANLIFKGTVFPFYQKHVDIHLKGTICPQFSGSLGQLSYFSEINVWTEYQSDTSFTMSTYEPYDGNPYNLFGRTNKSSVRSSDMFRGGIFFKGKQFDLETAVDYLRQGPMFYFPLTFSGENMPVTYFRARMDLYLLQYIHTFGLLRTQKDRPKYFYSHRLDFPLFNKKAICGLNAVIINGSTAEKAQTDSLNEKYYGEERSWEWVYLIPFIPYAFAEHYVGDRDNAILSIDFSVSFPQNFRWYLEFFIDDISAPHTLFNDDWGNKWAFTVGGQFFGTILQKDISITVEYSRVEPWVYTHFYGGSHRYTHYGKSLGSALGPNSDAFISIGEYGLSKHNSLGLFIKNIRKNENERGGSITNVFQEKNSSTPDSEKKIFLGKNYTRETTMGVFWRLNPFGIFNGMAEFTYNTKKETGIKLSGEFSF